MNLLIFFLIFFAVVLRLLPHAPNFTPLISTALFAGVYLGRKAALFLVSVALFISDALLGFYGSEMLFVYGSILFTTFWGGRMKKKKSPKRIFLFSVAGAVFFFLVTNFGVWLFSGMYPRNLVGLGECYGAAIPFFRNTLISTLIYSAVLFGAYELARLYVRQPSAIPE